MQTLQTVSVKYAGSIKVSKGNTLKALYTHQCEAIKALDEKNKTSFEGLLVLPTGGGKTLTAVHWLLRNHIDKRKKVLWIAHRHELLNQAFATVEASAFSSLLPNTSSFRYRIISGHPKHDRPVNIQLTDDIIIASKDSLNSGLNYLLNQWVAHQQEILLVVDEAHHATAKTYRKLIKVIKENFEQRSCGQGFKMLGLTATPFRTAENEQGLLKFVFPDDIIFSTHLRDLIARKILAEPIFESLETPLNLSGELTARDIQAIESFDKLPKRIAEKIAQSKERNRLIVDYYIKNRETYKPVLVFAIDVVHAIALNALFQQKGVKSDFIVSQIVDGKTKTTTSAQETSEKIARFRRGELEVLINVEMLTEGTDLPNVQTVFLARPTTSTILMTQMIGRVLRGKRSGGTEKAYIVSFVDDWEDKINWVNPEELIKRDILLPADDGSLTTKRIARLISIELIGIGAKIMDGTLGHMELPPFLKRIPVGLYRFSIDESLAGSTVPSEVHESVPRNYDMLLYSDTEEAYDDFIHDLEILFTQVSIDNREALTEVELADLLETAKELYFPDCQTLLGYRDEDVKNILRCYAQNQTKPTFFPFPGVEYDVAIVANHILEQDLRIKQIAAYTDALWTDENLLWQVLFDYNKSYFKRHIDIEIERFLNSDPPPLPPVGRGEVLLETLSLQQIKEIDLEEYHRIKEAVFARQTDSQGFITCAGYGAKKERPKSQMRRDFQIDHIEPMFRGGKTTLENLQVLSIKAHQEKTDDQNRERLQAANSVC